MIDGSHHQARRGGPKQARARSAAARPGSKHHVITDAHGTPLAITLTGGNRHDGTQLPPLLDAIPRIRGARGRPCHRPGQLHPRHGRAPGARRCARCSRSVPSRWRRWALGSSGVRRR
ncbi:transposase [Kitasatospora sp. NPDC057940]|uniref:transposase n=1 Tax=Kitasatospora sp. NPDC057940 TaxID=3346285 RepID=UPI0036DE1EC3